MSRILRRPMFRGGRVDSRGTGITSGLAGGGRVGYQPGGQVTGLDFLKWLNSSAITTAYARTNTIRLKMPTYDVVRSISIVLS